MDIQALIERHSFSKFTARAGWSALRFLMSALLLVLPAAGQKSGPDQFTPVIVSPLTGNTRPFPGTDGKYHVVYELVLTNTKPTPATLKKIEVLDARSQGVQSTAVVSSYEGDALVSRLRTLANTPANSPEIEFGGTRLFLIDLTFDSQAQVPGRLQHLYELTGASGPAPTPMTPAALSYTVAPLEFVTLAECFQSSGYRTGIFGKWHLVDNIVLYTPAVE